MYGEAYTLTEPHKQRFFLDVVVILSMATFFEKCLTLIDFVSLVRSMFFDVLFIRKYISLNQTVKLKIAYHIAK